MKIFETTNQNKLFINDDFILKEVEKDILKKCDFEEINFSSTIEINISNLQLDIEYKLRFDDEIHEIYNLTVSNVELNSPNDSIFVGYNISLEQLEVLENKINNK